MTLIGYARVSTEDQSVDQQLVALRNAGCRRIFQDKLSGASRNRPGLARALKNLQPGNTLVVHRLDRLGRSLSDLIQIMNEVQAAGCQFRSLAEYIDTGTAGGQLVFHVIGAMAEFERRLISERTIAGLAAAKARGIKLGKRPKLSPEQIEIAKALSASGSKAEAIAAQLAVGRSTLYRHLQLGRVLRKG